MQPLIELHHVNFGYADKLILNDINLHLHPGQFAGLVGPSGAGKTSLLKLVLGSLKASHGQVMLNSSASGRGKLRIGYVPQLETVDWNFPVTVEQVVWMGCIRQSGWWPWPTRAERAIVAGILERLEIGDLAGRHIRDLSGGQQQRVFLARALISEPDLLVLDEPTSGVDMRTAENILHLLAHLNQQGMTILLTTHDLNAAANHLPWVICLNKQIVAQGTPEEVFSEAVLNQTYQSDMIVLRQDGMIFIQQRPHSHGYRDVVPNPVPAHLPALKSVYSVASQGERAVGLESARPASVRPISTQS